MHRAQFVSQVEIGQSTVWGIALDPESNGEIFSTASQDGVLKLIDTRLATKNGIIFKHNTIMICDT